MINQIINRNRINHYDLTRYGTLIDNNSIINHTINRNRISNKDLTRYAKIN